MANLFQTLKNDWSLSATVAGFLAVLISYSGPLIIFFQAAQKANVEPSMMISWIWGISIGAAVAGIFLSIKSLYTTNFTEPLSYQDSAFLKLPKFP